MFDFIVDWFWVGFMLRLKRSNVAMFWALITLQIGIVAGLIGLAAYLGGGWH